LRDASNTSCQPIPERDRESPPAHHRKDADGLPLHKALAFLWQQCRDPEAILCAADRRRTPSETKRRREAAAAAEASRTDNSVNAVLLNERDRLWNHSDRATVRKARIASAM